MKGKMETNGKSLDWEKCMDNKLLKNGLQSVRTVG